MSVSIRNANLQDAEHGYKFTRAAGWQFHIPAWQQFVTSEQSFMLTTSDGTVIGTSCLYPQGEVAAVGPTLVDAAHRRKGYAAQLIRHGIAYAESLPEERRPKSLWLSASKMGQGVYAKIGFEEVSVVKSFGHELKPTAKALETKPEDYLAQPGDGAGAATLTIELGADSIRTDDWEQVAKLGDAAMDLKRRASLEMLNLAHPRPSGGHQTAVRLQEGAKHCLIRDAQSGRIVAFALARRQRSGYEIGPLIAQDRSQALAILSSLFLDVYHSKSRDASSGAIVDGDPWGKVGVSMDATMDLEGEMKRFLEDEWGLSIFVEQPLMEYLVDREAAQRGEKGPMRVRDEAMKAGKKGEPYQFGIIDLSVL